MTNGKVILWCLGALVILFALAWITAWVEKVRPGKEYDERQQMLRGQAYRFAFFVGAGCFLVGFFCMEWGGTPELKTSTVLFICLLVQLTAFHVYCMLKDVALPLGDKGWLTVIGYACIGVSNLMNYRNKRQYIEAYEQYIKVEPDTTLPAPAGGPDLVVFQILGIAALILAAMHILRMMWNDREE